MLSYNTEILNILEPRVNKQDLHGYYGGMLSPDKTKLVAYTYVPLDSIDFDEYNYMLNCGHSVIGTNLERKKKYLDDGTYQMKSMEECINEGIYKAFSSQFCGIFYEGKWFIQHDLLFFDDQMTEEDAKAYFSWRDKLPDHWNESPFDMGLIHTIPGTDESMRDVEREEFTGMPWLVSHMKIEHKTKVNRAFTTYMNTAVVHPFLSRMRIRSFDEFNEFISLFGYYTLVFPENKAHFLIVTMAGHKVKGYRLVWFFYDPVLNKFYRWTYPTPRFSEWSYHYPEDVIQDLHTISDWNDCRFLNSSRTMDNQRFWSEFVLKKEDGRYQWLEEIE